MMPESVCVATHALVLQRDWGVRCNTTVAALRDWWRHVLAFCHSNQVEPALGHLRAIAVKASAADDESVADGVEQMLPRDFLHGGFNGGALKLDHFAALLALQVFVLRIAVVVLIAHP